MNYYLVYLLKVILFHGVCYLLYWTTLRKSNYFSLNRAYLLCTLILGFIAPVVTLPVAGLPVDQVISDVNVAARTFSEAEPHVAASPSLQTMGESFSIQDLFRIIYIAGILILMLRTVLGVMLILRIKARGVENPSITPQVITIKESTSFSFINTIFLQEFASRSVFLHEKSHVVGKHWLDLVLVEIVCIFFWLNPMVWFYRKSLKQQHEYIADDYVLGQGIPQEEYLLCLLNSLYSEGPKGPVHKFNSQSLKQRIIMMTRDNVLSHSKFVYITIIPIVALMFLSFSGSKSPKDSINAGKIFVIDAAHGGNDAGAISSTGLTEKEITLNIARLVQEIGKAKDLNILLTRAEDQTLSFKERIAVSTEAKAEVFLSLHLGFDEGRVHKGAGLYVSKENIKYTESKGLAAILIKELSGIKEFDNPQMGNFEAFVLRENPATSAILEIGCLSDEGDVKFISDPMNQRRVAEKIVSALMKY